MKRTATGIFWLLGLFLILLTVGNSVSAQDAENTEIMIITEITAEERNVLVAELEKTFAEMTEPEEIAHAAQQLMAYYLDDENSDGEKKLRRENLAKAEDFYWENVAGNEEMPTSDTRYFVAKMLQYALKHGFLPEAERYFEEYLKSGACQSTIYVVKKTLRMGVHLPNCEELWTPEMWEILKNTPVPEGETEDEKFYNQLNRISIYCRGGKWTEAEPLIKNLTREIRELPSMQKINDLVGELIGIVAKNGNLDLAIFLWKEWAEEEKEEHEEDAIVLIIPYYDIYDNLINNRHFETALKFVRMCENENDFPRNERKAKPTDSTSEDDDNVKDDNVKKAEKRIRLKKYEDVYLNGDLAEIEKIWAELSEEEKLQNTNQFHFRTILTQKGPSEAEKFVSEMGDEFYRWASHTILARWYTLHFQPEEVIRVANLYSEEPIIRFNLLIDSCETWSGDKTWSNDKTLSDNKVWRKWDIQLRREPEWFQKMRDAFLAEVLKILEAERSMDYYVTDLGYPAGLEDFLQSDEWQFHQNMFRVYITMNHSDEAEKELETLKSLFASALKQAENAEDAEEADFAEMEAEIRAEIEAQVQEVDMEINAELRAEIETAIKAELEAIQKENALFRKADLKSFAEEMGREFDAQGVQILILRGKYDDALTKMPTLPEKRQEEVFRMLLEQRLLAEGLAPALESARKIPSPTVRFNAIYGILRLFY